MFRDTQSYRHTRRTIGRKASIRSATVTSSSSHSQISTPLHVPSARHRSLVVHLTAMIGDGDCVDSLIGGQTKQAITYSNRHTLPIQVRCCLRDWRRQCQFRNATAGFSVYLTNQTICHRTIPPSCDQNVIDIAHTHNNKRFCMLLGHKYARTHDKRDLFTHTQPESTTNTTNLNLDQDKIPADEGRFGGHCAPLPSHSSTLSHAPFASSHGTAEQKNEQTLTDRANNKRDETNEPSMGDRRCCSLQRKCLADNLLARHRTSRQCHSRRMPVLLCWGWMNSIYIWKEIARRTCRQTTSLISNSFFGQLVDCPSLTVC